MTLNVDIIAADPTAECSFWRDLTAKQRDEFRAFAEEHGIPAIGGNVMSITYDVIDIPLLRYVRAVSDEDGRPMIADDGETIVTETREVPVRGPLPAWWTPVLP